VGRTEDDAAPEPLSCCRNRNQLLREDHVCTSAGEQPWYAALGAGRPLLGPDWTCRPTFQQEVSAAVEQPQWVIDGNYSAVRDIIWRRCTAIVWLDYSFARVFSQALRRTIRRVVMGERLYSSNRETIRNALFDVEAPLWLVARTHGKRRRELPELFKRPEYDHATLIQFTTPLAAQAFLQKLGAEELG
jgi:uncharacterized membrane protein